MRVLPDDVMIADAASRAREILAVEAEALRLVADRLDASFVAAIEAILACDGHVIVCGVGKPWFVAQKISATLASTGTPSFPLHPAEAAHGDIGRVQAGDVVIVLSNSGSSDEITRIVPLITRFGATLIAVTGHPKSPLGQAADVVIGIGAITEACPLGLAPSASSTALLAIGDALALVTLERRQFTHEDYARFHPAGALGRQLMRVTDVMRPLARTPMVAPEAALTAVLGAITDLRGGAAFIVDRERRLLGIFTDGDLRRAVTSNPSALTEPVGEHMTASPSVIAPDVLVGRAQRQMVERRIDELPVVDGDGRLLGYVDAQDFLDVTRV